MIQLALSVRQPWAWHILNGKDIENRCWSTKVRGRVLIHAAKGCTRAEYWAGSDSLWLPGDHASPPPLADLHRGGIVGSVEIIDCVTESESPWFGGPFGFVLREPRPLPFFPCRGMLGFFRVDMPGGAA